MEAIGIRDIDLRNELEVVYMRQRNLCRENARRYARELARVAYLQRLDRITEYLSKARNADITEEERKSALAWADYYSKTAADLLHIWKSGVWEEWFASCFDVISEGNDELDYRWRRECPDAYLYCSYYADRLRLV